MSRRIGLVAGMLGLGLLLIVARLIHLTVVQRDTLAQRAAGQYRHRETVAPPRGAIVDRSGRRLAFSVGAESLYVHPAKLPADVDDMIPVLAQLSLSTRTTGRRRLPFLQAVCLAQTGRLPPRGQSDQST